jgi:hypothetical protein
MFEFLKQRLLEQQANGFIYRCAVRFPLPNTTAQSKMNDQDKLVNIISALIPIEKT